MATSLNKKKSSGTRRKNKHFWHTIAGNNYWHTNAKTFSFWNIKGSSVTSKSLDIGKYNIGLSTKYLSDKISLSGLLALTSREIQLSILFCML